MQAILDRLHSCKEILWKKTVGFVGGLWLALSGWDLIKSELLPKKYESWTVVEKTPHLTWTTWVIVLLLILLVILLEGAHAAIQKRDVALKASRSSISAKVTMSRDWPGDWKLAEDGFRRYEKSFVRADWFRDNSGPLEKWTLTGDKAALVHDCEALCFQAGKLLIVSPMSAHVSTALKFHENEADRWLYFLKERYGLESVMLGESEANGQRHSSMAGSIQSLAATSARACIECGAKSF